MLLLLADPRCPPCPKCLQSAIRIGLKISHGEDEGSIEAAHKDLAVVGVERRERHVVDRPPGSLYGHDYLTRQSP